MVNLGIDRRLNARRVLPKSNDSSVCFSWKASASTQIFRSRRPSSPTLLQLASRHLFFALVVAVVMLPTFVTRAIVYGGPFETGYVALRYFLWRSPVFLSVLFSSEHGLLSWTPVLAFAILGLILFAIRLPKVGVPFAAAMVAFYLFICFYPDWAGISSYGNRFFVSLTPLFVIGLAYFLERVAARFPSPGLRWLFAPEC